MKEKKSGHQSNKEQDIQCEPVESQEADTANEEMLESEQVKSETVENSADRISELEKENTVLKDQYLRKVADFDNYRKRMIKEKQEAFDYANTNLLADLLDSLDNFDRALEADASDPVAIKQGIEMTKTQLVNMLESKYNLIGYGQKGDVFDPNIHEAIGSMQGAVPIPTCSEIYLKGYKLKDRVLRHAKVMVTMPDGSVEEDKTDTDSVSEETEN